MKSVFIVLPTRYRIRYNLPQESMPGPRDQKLRNEIHIMRQKTKVEAFVLLLCAFLAFSCGPALASGPGPADSKNVELVGRLDIEGGGMVNVHDGITYIGHMKPPSARSACSLTRPT